MSTAPKTDEEIARGIAEAEIRDWFAGDRLATGHHVLSAITQAKGECTVPAADARKRLKHRFVSHTGNIHCARCGRAKAHEIHLTDTSEAVTGEERDSYLPEPSSDSNPPRQKSLEEIADEAAVIIRNFLYLAPEQTERIRKLILAALTEACQGRDERLLAVQKRLDDWIADCEHYSELCDQKDLRIQRLEKALTRLQDCDWVITPHDRMDAVRDIARAALS